MDSTGSCMVMVMGLTGSGKSHFINKLVEDAVKESPDLKSETKKCQVVHTYLCGVNVALVDTPGFDDTSRSDSEILDEILQFLMVQYECGITLRGIIYLHKITDNKMTGSSKRYLEIFKHLCGTGALGNVCLVTTHWDELKDKDVGMARAKSLRQVHWRPLLQREARMFHFDGTTDGAEGIVMHLLAKSDVTLAIQKSLMIDNVPFENTVAGKLMISTVDEEMEDRNKRLREFATRAGTGASSGDNAASYQAALEADRNVLRAIRDRFKGFRLVDEVKAKVARHKDLFSPQTAVQVFATVLGITSTIINIVQATG